MSDAIREMAENVNAKILHHPVDAKIRIDIMVKAIKAALAKDREERAEGLPLCEACGGFKGHAYVCKLCESIKADPLRMLEGEIEYFKALPDRLYRGGYIAERLKKLFKPTKGDSNGDS